uniref:Beta-1,3-glucosyltransferase n=1 Tax=Culex pipiens TaxID=7175 RepID=A0A8D8KNY8_CULPI
MKLIMHSSLLILAFVLVLLLVEPIQPTPSEERSEPFPVAPNQIAYLVLSQSSSYHSERAQALRRSILEQQSQLVKFSNHPSKNFTNTNGVTIKPDDTGTSTGNVHLSHERFADHEGSWAITPILKHIRTGGILTGRRWLIICEENSHVNVSLLVHHLAQEDYRQEHFLGYPLHDREATIIHHFAFFKNPSSFRYPWVRAGLILTTPLVDHLLGLLARGPAVGTEFFIDVGHEFALLAWNRGSPSGSRTLTPVPYLCAHPGPGCAIAASPSEVPAVVTGPTRDHHLHPEPPVAAPSSVVSTPAEILFAVKTCEKFHAERVPVLLNTWAKYVQHLRLYSDTGDASIPTIGTSIPNTSIGHCAKTLEILHLVREELRHNPGLTDVRWIMLVDDDTILSPSALAHHLGHYNPSVDLYLGERYGYHLLSRDATGSYSGESDGQGYNYITGGGGIVLSVAILADLLDHCECPSATSPDDMIIAACLYRLGVRPIHSPLFHQARPSDYAPETLDPGAISFHKHWQIDPYQVYNRWFRRNDERWWNRPAAEPLLQSKHISNDNDSVRQTKPERHHSRHRLVKVAGEEPPLEEGLTGSVTSDVLRYQSEHHQLHISQHSSNICESNELQSNSNLLLHHPAAGSDGGGDGFPESNIIKHSEL